MNETKLTELLERKKERQVLLNERKRNIEEIDFELFFSNVKKSFMNIGYSFKRLLLLLIGGSLLLISITLLIKPNIIYNNLGFMNNSEQEANYRLEEYSKIINISEIDKNKLQNFLLKDIESNRNNIIRKASIFLLILSLFLLYKIKQLKVLRNRNRLILKANRLTQSIIEDYKHFIKEESIELNELEDVFKELKAGNNVYKK